MEFKMEYLHMPYEHDDNTCRALKEFKDLPRSAKHIDKIAIANKYNTTLQEMKEHEYCWRRG